MKRRGVFYIKRVSFYLLIWILTVSLGSWGAAISAPAEAQGRAANIPEHLGSVEEVYEGAPDKPTVYYIQDAHSIFTAQKTIQELISELQNKEPVTLVALEGASSFLDTDLLRAFPDKEKVEDILWSYVKKGEMSGTEVESVLGKAELYHGIENREIYEKNLRAFREAYKSFKASQHDLKTAETSLNTIVREHLSEDLQNFLNTKEKFESGEIRLPEHLRRLRSFGLGADNLYPHLSGILNILENEELINEDAELKKSLDQWLKTQLRKYPATRQIKNDYYTGRLSLTDAVRAVQEHIEVKLLTESEKELLAHVASKEKFDAAYGIAVMEELEKWIETKEDSLAAGIPRGDEVLSALRNYGLLKKLLSLELSIEDWEKAKENLEQLNSFYFRELFKSFGVEQAPEWDFQKAVDYYDIVLERDTILSSNLTKLLVRTVNPDEAAILVTGGFHRKGITDHLKSEGYSFYVISPQFSVSGESPYLDVMLEGGSYSVPRASATANRVTLDNSDPYHERVIGDIGTALLADSEDPARTVLLWEKKLLFNWSQGKTRDDISASVNGLNNIAGASLGEEPTPGRKFTSIISTLDVLNNRNVQQDVFNFLYALIAAPRYNMGRVMFFSIDQKKNQINGWFGLEASDVEKGSFAEEHLLESYESWMKRGRERNLTVYEKMVKSFSFFVPTDNSSVPAVVRQKKEARMSFDEDQIGGDPILFSIQSNDFPLPTEYILLPVIHGDEVLGVVYVDGVLNVSEEKEIDDEKLRSIKIFVKSLARSLDNSRAFENLYYELTHDRLVQDVFSQRGIDEKVPGILETAIRKKQDISFVSGDLDRLKIINDTFGHIEGNSYIQYAFRKIKQNIQYKDVLGRPHGDEIIIILPDTDMHDAYEKAERMRKSVNELNFSQAVKVKAAEDLKPSVSLGLTTYKAFPITERYAAFLPHYNEELSTETIPAIRRQIEADEDISLGPGTVTITEEGSKFKGEEIRYFIFDESSAAPLPLEEQIKQFQTQIYEAMFIDADAALFSAKGRKNAVSTYTSKDKEDYLLKQKSEAILRKTRVTAQEEFRKMPFSTHKLDADGRILDVTDKWIKLLGWSRQEVIGREIFDFLPDDPMPEKPGTTVRIQAKANHFSRMGRPERVPEGIEPSPEKAHNIHLSRDYIHKDGSRVTVFSTHLVHEDVETGEKMGITTTIQDAQMTKYLRDLARLAGSDQIAFEEHGIIFHMDSRIATLLGYTMNEQTDRLIGMNIVDLFPEGEAEKIREIIKSEDPTKMWKTSILNKEGSFTDVSLSKASSKYPNITTFTLTFPKRPISAQSLGGASSLAEISLLNRSLADTRSKNSDLSASHFFALSGASLGEHETEAAKLLQKTGNDKASFFDDKIEIPEESRFLMLDLNSLTEDPGALSRMAELVGEWGKVFPFYTDRKAFERFRKMHHQLPVELRAKFLDARKIEKLDTKNILSMQKRAERQGLEKGVPVSLLISNAELLEGDFPEETEVTAFQFTAGENDPTLSKTVYSIVFDYFSRGAEALLFVDKEMLREEQRSGISIFGFDLMQLADILTARWEARTAILRAA